MHLDIDEYMDCLDTLNLSREQKEQIIRTVWNLMEAEVDKVFGLHPVQQYQSIMKVNHLQIQPKIVDSRQSRFLKKFGTAANDSTYIKEKKHYG